MQDLRLLDGGSSGQGGRGADEKAYKQAEAALEGRVPGRSATTTTRSESRRRECSLRYRLVLATNSQRRGSKRRNEKAQSSQRFVASLLANGARNCRHSLLTHSHLTEGNPEAAGFFDEYSRQVTSSLQPHVHEFFWGLEGGSEEAVE